MNELSGINCGIVSLRHSAFLEVILYSDKTLKGNAQFVQKVTFEPLMDFRQNHYESWKYYKSCCF